MPAPAPKKSMFVARYGQRVYVTFAWCIAEARCHFRKQFGREPERLWNQDEVYARHPYQGGFREVVVVRRG